MACFGHVLTHCLSTLQRLVLQTQATGYVEFDTAGQSNMYPVITKAYEAGSDADTTNTGAANLVIGAGAAVIGVGVLAVGLGALTQQASARKCISVFFHCILFVLSMV